MLEFRNDYSNAGKGAKHRQRERRALETQSKPDKTETFPVQSRKEGRGERGRRQRPNEIKDRIRRLHLEHGLDFNGTCATLKREGYLVSAVTVSAIRTDFVQALKLIISVGVIDPDELEEYRRRQSRKRVRPSV